MSKQLRTVAQAAEDLSLSVHTVRQWIARRKIVCVRIGRAVRVPASEIDRLVEEGTVPVASDRFRRVV